MGRFWDSFPEKEAHMYSLRSGLVYTARYATPFETERVPAVLLISLGDRDISLRHRGRLTKSKVILVGPGLRRSIGVWDTPFAGVHIGPSHAIYRALMELAQDTPVRALESTEFQTLRQQLTACFEREASVDLAQQALDATVDILSDIFAIRTSRDPRIAAVIEDLAATSPLDYRFSELLQKVTLSPGRFSHLFTEEVGISLRSYQKWRKIREALRLLQGQDSLTAVAHCSGFSDSAHFSRTFSSTFGLVPTLFRPGRCVQVITDSLH